MASIVSYMEGVERRVAERERQEKEENERRIRDLRDRQAEEDRLRAEDEAALEVSEGCGTCRLQSKIGTGL